MSSIRIEAGGNIFELIEFTLDRVLPSGEIRTGRYGVNVAKVREVVRMPSINPLASRVPGVAGVFELRGIPIPAINLAVALGDKETPVAQNQQIIVTEFSLKRAGFIIKSTERIRRIAWEKVLPPTSDRKTCISGMTLIENNEFLFILDLEKVLLEIEVAGGFMASDEIIGEYLKREKQRKSPTSENSKPKEEEDGTRILLVDDSNFVLSNTKNVLEKVGYRVVTASDGANAKRVLEDMLKNFDPQRMIQMIVSDVEMPQMDGLALTRWVKSHPELCQIPVVLHTSLSGDANQNAGELVGADGYVVKNDIRNLIEKLHELTATGSKIVAKRS